MAPTPKPPGQRRRRNAVAGIQTLSGGEPLAKPDCPVRNRQVQRWWDAAWGSPMAAAWSAGDLAALERLAQLWGSFVADPNPQVATVIVALEDRLGLSPKARRQLGWEIAQSAGREAAKAAAGPLEVDDLRLRLVRS